ncbi:hypothetical protein [Lysobacter capsici]|uniref:hypothetical protein n=1 Tax=Lysobacter capsici TaxID=435897 RepID=UPI001C006984|nr:hypothetical protein [Lysobacter capsici]QWF16042.1 hypothetical protein KME82_20080 [Lysobacter capsici]
MTLLKGKGPGGVVYSTDDRWNAYITRNRSGLRGAGALFPFSSATAINLVADKLALPSLADGIVDVPETRLYEQMAVPVDSIVKPRFPFNGLVIRKKGASVGEIVEEYGRGEAFVIQKRILAPLRSHFSLCGLRTNKILGALVYAKALEYPHPGGTSTLSVIVDDAQLHDQLLGLSEQLLDRLRYQGPFEIEFIRCEGSGNLFLIDVNLRFWLQHELGRLLGIDYAALYRRWLSGESVSDPIRLPGRVAWVHEGFPLSLVLDYASARVAVREMLGRRCLLAHLRRDDPRPFWRFLGV